MVSRRILGLGAAVVSLSLLTAACSSGSTKSGSNPSGASASASGSTWVIGSLGTNSGRASSTVAAAKPAMEAWASWTNAHGGISGHPIKVIYGDDQGQTSVGLSLAQQMVETDHIIAMVGSSAQSAPGIAAYLSEHKIPVIGGQSPIYVATVQPFPTNFYTIGPTLAASSVTSFRAAKNAGATKVGILYCAESPTCQSIVSTFKGFAAQVGLSTTYQSAVSATAPNYTAPCLAVKNSGADSLVLAVDNHTLQLIAQQCAQQGFKPIIVGQAAEVTPSWATDPSFASAVGSLYAFPWWNNSVPAIADYNAAMKQYDSSGSLPASANPGIATSTWAAGQAFAAAAKAAKLGDDPTSVQVTQGMITFKGETLSGLVGPLTFTSDSVLGSSCAYVFRINNNAFESLNDGKPDCVS